MSFAGLRSFLWRRLGEWLHGKGLPLLAAACFRHADSADLPGAAEALCAEGKRLLEQDRIQEGVRAYEMALGLQPQLAKAWAGLGAARRMAGDLAAARTAYEKAIELDPGNLQTVCNLGEWWLVNGETEQAIACFDRVLDVDPAFYEALANKAVALFECGRGKDAERELRAAIERYPDRAPLHVNLGNVLLHSGRGRLALIAFRRALELDPACREARYNLAILQSDLNAIAQAKDFIEREIEIKGETANRLTMLALAQRASGQLSLAAEACRRVLDRQPQHLSALITLASLTSARGDVDQAVEIYERVIEQAPHLSTMYSNILADMTYSSGHSPAEIFARHRQWAERYEAPKAPLRYRHVRPADTGGRLRIGYVSGDFCHHPVGALFRDVISHHDHEGFEIHCFTSFISVDEITRAIRGQADAWHDIALMPDDEVARLIHEQRIDILVDLSGHTALNRLGAFAFKPAPVQATWIGYFHSTGLDAIDYFITDPYTSPRGSPQLFSETPVHLPHSRFCYAIPDYAPEVADCPSERNGYVAFGSFNRVCKMTDGVVEAWSRILAGTPGSRLILKSRGLDDPAMAERMRSRFASHGIDGGRIELRPPSGHLQMFNEYGDIDIALDPFPFTGGMTTLEALLMGVPVVTCAGTGVVSRQTVSALHNVGCPELAFPDLDAYVEGAITLAGDADRRRTLRRELRDRMRQSPICQPARFVQDVEALYRRMWLAWCEGRRLPSDILPADAATLPPSGG